MFGYLWNTAVDWSVSLLRLRASAPLETIGPNSSSRIQPGPKEVRILESKCACGAINKFRDPLVSASEGYLRYPEEDHYSCPSCGRTVSLKEAVHLASDAQFPRRA